MKGDDDKTKHHKKMKHVHDDTGGTTSPDLRVGAGAKLELMHDGGGGKTSEILERLTIAFLDLDDVGQALIMSFLGLEDAVHLSQTCTKLHHKCVRTNSFQWLNTNPGYYQRVNYLIHAINSIDFSYLEKIEVVDLSGSNNSMITTQAFPMLVVQLKHAVRLKHFEINFPQLFSCCNTEDMSPVFDCLSTNLKCCSKLSTVILHFSSGRMTMTNEFSSKLLTEFLLSFARGIKNHPLTRFELLQHTSIIEFHMNNEQKEDRINFFIDILTKKNLKVFKLTSMHCALIEAFTEAQDRLCQTNKKPLQICDLSLHVEHVRYIQINILHCFSTCYGLKKFSLELESDLWNTNVSPMLQLLGKCNYLEEVNLDFKEFRDTANEVMNMLSRPNWGCNLTMFHMKSLNYTSWELIDKLTTHLRSKTDKPQTVQIFTSICERVSGGWCAVYNISKLFFAWQNVNNLCQFVNKNHAQLRKDVYLDLNSFDDTFEVLDVISNCPWKSTDRIYILNVKDEGARHLETFRYSMEVDAKWVIQFFPRGTNFDTERFEQDIQLLKSDFATIICLRRSKYFV